MSFQNISFRDTVIQYLETLRKEDSENENSEDEENEGDESEDENYHYRNNDKSDSDDEYSEDEDDEDEDDEDEDDEDEDDEDEDGDDEESDEDDDDNDEDEDDDEGEDKKDKNDLISSSTDSLVESDSENSSSSEDELFKVSNEKEEVEEKEDTDSENEYYSKPLEVPTLHHMYSNEPFYHIPKYDFDINVKGVEQINFSLFPYVICNNIYGDPYMTVLLEYSNNGKFFELPTVEYNVYNVPDHRVSIKNQCFERIYEIMNITPGNIDDDIIGRTEKAFKGFYHKTGTTEGCIGIDMEDFIPFLNKHSDAETLSEFFHTNLKNGIPKNTWGLIDEIIDTKKVVNVPIDPKCTKLLEDNPWFYEIHYDDYTPTLIPKSLYSDDEKLTRSHTDEMGRIYVFSREIPENLFEDKRYVCYPNIQFEKDKITYYGVLTKGRFREF